MTRDLYEMSRCDNPLKAEANQVRLLDALLANDFVTFENLISQVDLNYEYQYPFYKTCLEIAVSELGKQNFVKLLLQYQAEVNNINSTRGEGPIHFAVKSGNIDALKRLLENNEIIVDRKSKNNTALFMAIKQIPNLTEDDRKRTYEDIVEILLKKGANANSPDSKGITPIYFATKNKLEKVINLIYDHSQIRINLDKYVDRNGKTARDLLKDEFPSLLAKFETDKRPIQLINNDELFFYLNSDEEDNFIRLIETLDIEDRRKAFTDNNGRYTMLQLAVEKGFDRVVDALLLAGADPNGTFSGNKYRPVGIACKNGFSEILEMFIKNELTLFDPIDGDSLIQLTLKGVRCYGNNPKANFNRCLELLLRHLHNDDINHQDSKNNTALHYAARNGDDDAVLELLRNGACVSLRNIFNVPPLADINAKTLETHLDECLTTNGERPGDDGYEINMKYRFLVYPNSADGDELNKPLVPSSNNNFKQRDVILAPETDALLYMTQNEELRPLLQHPVITSFLYLKWQRISCLFHANITFYSLFWLCLILYIVLDYGVEKNEGDSVKVLNIFTKMGVIIGLILLIMRELFQLLVSPTTYLKNISNYIEIALILVIIFILCSGSADKSIKQQVSPAAILLSSAELVLLIGQFPTLSTNVEMLKTVSYNFLKFLLWYCIIIIAFALSFYTLFRHMAVKDKKENNSKNGNETNPEESFFEDPAISLFKTLVMLTGEFETGSIKFSAFPITSHIIFIFFIFLVPIVLFNLLNGLAVSDTQAIKADAELVGHVSCIKLISYFESVILTNLNKRNSKYWSYLPSHLQDLCIIKPIAKQITLFPHYLPKYEIIVKPNQDNKIEIPQMESSTRDIKDDEQIEKGQCCLGRFQNNTLNQDIVKKAKVVINKKKNVSEFEQMKKFFHAEIASIRDLVLKKN